MLEPEASEEPEVDLADEESVDLPEAEPVPEAVAVAVVEVTTVVVPVMAQGTAKVPVPELVEGMAGVAAVAAVKVAVLMEDLGTGMDLDLGLGMV